MRKWIISLAIILSLVPATAFAATSLDAVNQKICDRFEDDTSRLAGIMDEVRRRAGITETRVAFGNVDTQIENADYQITYVAEAIAFQRAQKFSSVNSLKSSLGVLRQKVLRAKTEVGKAI